MGGEGDIRHPHPAPPHFKSGVERNDPALGYTKHADAILLEPRDQTCKHTCPLGCERHK
jgi:hypothetical protein